MQLHGKVLNARQEPRELTGKNGDKRKSLVSYVVLDISGGKGKFEICNIRCYDAKWVLPSVGADWVSPNLRRYECYDGTIGDALVADVM